jgi:peptidoglycan/LPS O-acetylase OafA/YrhL
LAFLDLLRGVAALAVVVQHSLEVSWPGFLDASVAYFSPGQLGVTVFLLVSGFIIPVSLERGGSNYRFWVSRFFRLFPLYWLSIALAFLVYRLDLHSPATLAPHSMPEWLINLTMLQEFLRVPHILGVFWTLTLELILYTTCSVLFSLKVLRRSYVLAWLGLAILAAAGTVCPLVLGKRFPAGYAFLLQCGLVGAVLYRSFAGQIRRPKVGVLLAILATAAAGVAYFNFALFQRSGLPFTWTCALTTWVTAYLVFLAILSLRHKAMPRPLVWCGKISYSMYLLHPLVLMLLPHGLPPLLFLPAMIVGTVTVASLTYTLVEKPCIGLGQRVQARWRRPAAAAPATVHTERRAARQRPISAAGIPPPSPFHPRRSARYRLAS